MKEKLIVGLGNPGPNYEKTRHNVGFMAIDNYANDNKLVFKKKFNGLYVETNINNSKVILLKPQSYMNLSGDVVNKFISFYNIDLKDVLIIYDDVVFEAGTFRIKRGGSSAGHNGMNDIINKLNTSDIYRIRIGTSKTQDNLINYVLKKIPKNDYSKIVKILPTINNIIEDFSIMNIEELMQKYNKKDNNERKTK